MNGRDERSLKIEEKLMKDLDQYPEMLREFLTTTPDLLPITKETYKGILVAFFKEFEEKKHWDMDDPEVWKRFRPVELSQYIYDIDAGLSHKRKVFFALRRFFEFLFVNRYIKEDPVRYLKAPKRPKAEEAVALDEEEIEQLLYNVSHPREADPDATDLVTRRREECINRNLAMVSLGLTDGLRASSIIEINVQDVDIENKVIRVVQKGDRYHNAYLGENTLRILMNWMEDRKKIVEEKGIKSDALFLTIGGKRMNNQEINRLLKWATKDFEKNISVHKLRSTCATRLYEQTGNIYLTARVLGHASVTMTERYIKPNEDQSRNGSVLMDELLK